jgi:O-antigen ligase
MLDFAFAIVLILNATNLFSFLAAWLGVPIYLVSAALLLVNFALIAAKPHALASLLRTDVKWWAVVLFAWPVVAIGWAPVVDAREVALLAYYASLLVAAVLFARDCGRDAMHAVCLLSLLVTAGGVLLSLYTPGPFMAVARAADASTDYMGRAYGFFIQPNSAALALNLLYLGWFSTSHAVLRSALLFVLAPLAFLACVMLTGSRGGVLGAGLIVAMQFLYAWQHGRIPAAKLQLRTFATLALLAGSVYMTRGHLASSRTANDLMLRISSLVNGRISVGVVGRDVSIQGRLAAWRYYADRVSESPLIGHGTGAERYFVQRGLCQVTSHSGALSSAVNYGVFYPVAVVLLLLRLVTQYRRTPQGRGFNPVTQFVAFALFVFLFDYSFFPCRPFYVVGAIFLASAYCTARVPARRVTASPRLSAATLRQL